MAFYKEKAKRLTGSEEDYVKVMKISPAEGEKIVSACACACWLTWHSLTELAICEDQTRFVPRVY